MTMKDWVCKGFSINIFDRSMRKMKMKKGLLMTALITGTLMSSAAAFAEELQEYTLDQMVVTATRYEKRDVEVAASTEVFDAKNCRKLVQQTCMTH